MTRGRPDGGLRKTLHSKLPRPDWIWSAVETGASAAGLPDSHFLHRPTGTCGWVECKACDHWAIKFEPHQIAFWRLHGPHVRGFVLVRARGLRQTDGLGDGLYIFDGTDVDELSEVGLRATPLLRMPGAQRGWDWSVVSGVLLI